ncbi:MAG: tyrosine-type recombinase/integrase [Sphingomonas sp.]|nr:tyrosine-type recombinase/integrase [Sphingomonas sp.]
MLTDSRVAAFKPPARGQKEYPDQKVTGLRLRVGAGGTKAWIFRARTGERTINRKLGTYPGMNLSEARTAALKVISAISRGGSAEAVERTFGAVAYHWIEKVAQRKNDSWEYQRRRLELHVLPAWRDRKIVDIRRADVRTLLDGLEGVVLPNRVLALVKTIFRYALSQDWIDFSPAEGIPKPQIERERDRVLTMKDVAQIWKAAELLGYPFGPYVRLLALTAQRRTEVASMRWDDLDLDAGMWTIPAASTKGERRHFVPLAAAAVEILERLPRLGVYVFATDGRTHMTNYAKLKTRLDAFVAASGGGVAAWRLHDLRRSAATHMVRLGVREEVVGRVLNHAVKGVTARVYALHSYGPEKRQALDTWAEEVERTTCVT